MNQELSRPPPASSLEALGDALPAIRALPVQSLRACLKELGLMEDAALGLLAREEPRVLLDQSHLLVDRFLVSEEDLQHALARTAGVAEVDAGAFSRDSDALHFLPLADARRHRVLPLGLYDGQFFIASWRPTDESLHRYLEHLTGHLVVLVWADGEAITAALSGWQAFRRAAPPAIVPPILAVRTDTLEPVDDVEMTELVANALVEVSQHPQKNPDTVTEVAGVVRLVRKLIVDALRLGASDIHIESNPGSQVTRVRLRRDGDLEPYLELPADLRASLISRIKIMARLDISEHRRPQDGKIDFAEYGGSKLELRVAVLPTHDGMEDVVMRLLATTKPIALGHLGLQDRDQAVIARMMARSFGLILAAGPTGSGKTTTLHSMLQQVNTEERKIWTAEDPIEITQPGLRQVQVNPKIGLTFAAAMRAFLRADPDIIMIGEIRDEETARTAIDASLTGHLVVSTVHTNSAAESVVRLLDMGMDPMNFADSLIGIISQRLVRALCPRCKRLHRLSARQFTRFVQEYVEGTRMDAGEAERRILLASGASTPSAVQFFQAVGCDNCANTGYKGRMGIYEVLENSIDVRRLIQEGARSEAICESALAAGMHTLRHDALEKVTQGKIDIHQAVVAYR